MPHTPETAKKVMSRLAHATDKGTLGLVHQIEEVDQKIDAVGADLGRKVDAAARLAQQNEKSLREGLRALKPVAGEDYQVPENGLDGDNYILTESDKKEIAAMIEVPVVEKIIEKREVVREIPLVTQQIMEKAVPETGDVIARKLEALPEGRKVVIEAIEHLRDELNEIRRFKGGGINGAANRALYQLLDVSIAGITNGQSIQWDGNQWVAYTPSSSSITFVDSEEPIGSGSTFTLASAPVAGSLKLYRGGARQQQGIGKDFTLSGQTITLDVGLSSGEVLLADYRV